MAALLSVAGVIATGSGAAVAQVSEPWPIKHFQVVAVEPAGVVETGRRLDDPVERMVRIIRTETDYDPDFPLIWDEPTVSLPEATTLEAQDLLHEAAVKLESWGFPPPELDPVVQNEAGADVYRVYLVGNRAGSAGLYHSRPCSYGVREAVIAVDAVDILDQNGLLTDFGAMVLVHELVHAVQASFPSYDCGDGGPGQWVGEGTAEAIGWDLVKQERGIAAVRGRVDRAWGARVYSEQLPVAGGTGAMRAYLTSSFWRFLAEYNESRPTFPGPDISWPASYSFLPGLLRRDLQQPDCYYVDGPCDADLRWLDSGLRAQFGLPLRDLYARFIQAYALYGEGRVHSVEGGSAATQQKNWIGASFAHEDDMGCVSVVLGPDADSRQKRYVVPRFADLAARCWEVELEGFEDAVTLAVTASYRPGTRALLEQLTAVMADDSGRLDEADVRIVAGVPEATWYYSHLGTGDPSLFFLTNVADSPDATRGLANLSLTFTAIHEYVEMGVSGGDSTDANGPAPADIDQPIDFEVDEGDFTVFYVGPDDLADDAITDHPACTIWIKLRSADEDALWVMGNLSAPIRAGEYAIVSSPDGQADILASRLWTNQTAGRGRLQAFGKSGTLEIEAVDHLMIEGNISTHVHKGLEGGDVNLLVRAEFGLQPGSMIGGILGPKAADHPCFVEPDTPTPTGGTVEEDRNGRRGSDGRSTGNEDDRTDEDEESDQDDDPRRGGLPTDGGAGGERGPEDPGRPPPTGGGEPIPPGDSRGNRPADSGSALTLEFIDREGASIRSSPQEVRGAHSSERVDVAAAGFGLQLALQQDEIWQCVESENSGLAGIYALTGLAMGAAAAIDWDGWYRIDIRDADVEFNVDAGTLRLELDFEHCQEETNRCQSGTVVVLADPADVHMASIEGGSTRVDVAGAALEAELNRQKGSCDGLVDFSAVLRSLP